jgi:hypothetical protein
MTQCMWDVDETTWKQGRPCRKNVNYVILGGCLDQHIGNYMVCSTHAQSWIRCYLNKQIICGQGVCSNHVAEYEITQIEKVKVAFQ